jgi:hypothetical protein
VEQPQGPRKLDILGTYMPLGCLEDIKNDKAVDAINSVVLKNLIDKIWVTFGWNPESSSSPRPNP